MSKKYTKLFYKSFVYFLFTFRINKRKNNIKFLNTINKLKN